MKIGVVNFLNAYPLIYGLEKNENDIFLYRDVPSKLSILLKENKLDAALVSSIEYFRNRDIWQYHPNLCISSSGAVESIRLFISDENKITKKNNEFLKPIDTLYYDYASRSSVEMVRILLNYHFLRKNPNLVEINPPYKEKIHGLKTNECLLLIGDSALLNRDTTSIDLGKWYFDTFNLPFVYALWVYPKNSNIDKNIFNLAYETSLKEWKLLIEKAVKKFSFSKEFTEKYLKNIIQYTINNNTLKGLDFFFEKYKEITEACK
ncbi:MAG: menaquinone biosynthesis protein [Spirochaetia bacterium]|nr:menaquinone biosynthesis protein [Spirochaetia bacterium]